MKRTGRLMMSAAAGNVWVCTSRARRRLPITSSGSPFLITAEDACAWPPPPIVWSRLPTSTPGVRDRPVTNTRSSMVMAWSSTSALSRSITLWAKTLSPSTYSPASRVMVWTSCPRTRTARTSSIMRSSSVRCSADSGLCRKCSTSACEAPSRRATVSISASRTVVRG